MRVPPDNYCKDEKACSEFKFNFNMILKGIKPIIAPRGTRENNL